MNSRPCSSVPYWSEPFITIWKSSQSDSVCLVVNYDIPVTREGEPDFETYLHRIGRTGRFGRKGTAINLISDQQSIEVLAAIEGHFSTGGKEMIQNAEADPEALAEKIEI